MLFRAILSLLSGPEELIVDGGARRRRATAQSRGVKQTRRADGTELPSGSLAQNRWGSFRRTTPAQKTSGAREAGT